MLLEELKSVILQLDNSNRFHTINGKRDTWLYDSYTHKIYRIDEIYGTTLNNIGAYERTGIEKSTGSFLGDEEVHYYYDCEQFF